MTKLQVGDIVSSAFRFAFGEFFTLLRLSWIPLTIMMVSNLIILPYIFQEATGVSKPNQGMLGHGSIASFLAMYVIQCICIGTAIIAYTEHALHPSPDRKFLYLPSARVVGKVFASWLLTGLAFFAVHLLAFGVIYLSQLAGKTSSGMERPGAGFISTLVSLGVIGASFYAFIRVTFVLTPLVVAEGKIDLRRAWDLGRGNFWSYLGIALGLALPFAVVSLGISLIFNKLFAIPASALGPAQSAAEHQQAIRAWNATTSVQIRMPWPVIYAIYIGICTLVYGATAGASAFAYRALVPANQAPQSDA